MRHPRSALLAVLLLAICAGPASAARPAAADAARAEHQRIVAYWTADRLASATPRDFVRTGSGFSPAGKARPPSQGGNVSGASWTKGGLILRASGKVFFTMAGLRYTCSGSVASDARGSFSLVLTAGHCAYDESGHAFATNWIFIPQYDTAPGGQDCAASLLGCWTAQALVVHNGYASAGGFNTQATVHDFAFAVVGAGGKSVTQLDTAVGSFGLSTASLAVGSKLYAFGYPAAGKYNGNDLTYCAGPTFEDPYNSRLTWGMTCDMTGGSSGGPWLSSFTESSGIGTLSSLNSYGYSGVKAMHGPKFNAKTAAVYSAADTATSNTIVGP